MHNSLGEVNLELIKEEVSEKEIMLRSPSDGYFRRFVPDLSNQKIQPDLTFGKVKGKKLKCGVNGKIQKMIVDDGVYLKKGDPMVKITKIPEQSVSKPKEKYASDKTQKDNNITSYLVVYAYFFLVFIFFCLGLLKSFMN